MRYFPITPARFRLAVTPVNRAIQLLPIIVMVLMYFVFRPSFAPLINNGDFQRTTHCIGLNVPRLTVLQTHYAFGKLTGLPTTTLSALLMLFDLAERVLGFEQLSLGGIAVVLNLLYFLGWYGCLRGETGRAARLTLSLLFALCYLLYGVYFTTLYEEAAVLALAPWLLCSYQRLRDQGRLGPYLLTATLLLLAKVQMIFLAPVLIALLYAAKPPARYRRRTRIAAEFLLMVALASFYHSMDFAIINSYDRLYNGIGWSVQNAADWPASSAYPRIAYFYRHRNALQKISLALEPKPAEPRLGTSYWPSESAIYDQYKDEKHGKQIIADAMPGSLTRFADFFRHHPSVLPSYFKTIALITWRSDYGLPEWRRPNPDLAAWARAIAMLGNGLLANAGKLFLLGGVFGMLIRPRRDKTLLLSYFLLGAPLFTVLGDGFYEFEKHMSPYLILLPALVMARGGAAAHLGQSAQTQAATQPTMASCNCLSVNKASVGDSPPS